MSRSTSLSLLQRLRTTPESADWTQFIEVYEPLLRSWLRRNSVATDDASDIVQNILAVILRRLADFEHNGRTGAFRTWLRIITANCLKEYWRSRKGTIPAAGGSDAMTRLAELEDPESELSQAWNEEHDRHVMRKLLDNLRTEFEDRTWMAFQRFALDGETAAVVADELGITSNAVFIAKSRVLSRLRQEASGLLDE